MRKRLRKIGSRPTNVTAPPQSAGLPPMSRMKPAKASSIAKSDSFACALAVPGRSNANAPLSAAKSRRPYDLPTRRLHHRIVSNDSALRADFFCLVPTKFSQFPGNTSSARAKNIAKSAISPSIQNDLHATTPTGVAQVATIRKSTQCNQLGRGLISAHHTLIDASWMKAR